jgi:hypothetical protein
MAINRLTTSIITSIAASLSPHFLPFGGDTQAFPAVTDATYDDNPGGRTRPGGPVSTDVPIHSRLSLRLMPFPGRKTTLFCLPL